MTSHTWQTVALGTIAEFRNGVNFHDSDRGKGIKIIGVGDFQDRLLAPSENLVEINPEGVVTEQDLLQDDDILFVRSNGNRNLIGRSLFIQGIKEPITFSGFTIRLRFKSSAVCPLFYAHLLKSAFFRQTLSLYGSGTNISNLNQQTLRSLIVPLPPLPEQHKIAAILGTWDEAIVLTERRIAAAQQRKQGLMQRLLTGRARFPEFAERAWIEVQIGDVLQNVTRLVPLEDNQLYRQAIVRRWSAGIEYREPLYGHQIKGNALQQVHEGDFLISNIQAAYGAMSKVGKDSEGAWISNIYTILVPKHDRSVEIDFLNYLSQTPMMRQLVIASCNGFKAERVRLSFAVPAFLKQHIKIPAQYEEQRRIADVLTACDHELDLLARKRDALQQQKRGLMQQLLTGRVRVGGLDHGGAK